MCTHCLINFPSYKIVQFSMSTTQQENSSYVAIISCIICYTVSTTTQSFKLFNRVLWKQQEQSTLCVIQDSLWKVSCAESACLEILNFSAAPSPASKSAPQLDSASFTSSSCPSSYSSLPLSLRSSRMFYKINTTLYLAVLELFQLFISNLFSKLL